MELIRVWKVTTEGDCEGKSVKQLGIYLGEVHEIAFHLASKAYYALHFEEIPSHRAEVLPPTKDRVCISFGYGIKPQPSLVDLKHSLEGTGVKVSKGNMYSSFLLEDVSLRTRREEAIAKLTDEDRRILGV